MKFISKLYFNVFKKIGNIRLLFIISCVFIIVPLFSFTTGIFREVYYYHITSDITPSEEANIEKKRLNTTETEFNDTKKLDELSDLKKFYIMRTLKACKDGDIARAKFLYLSDGEKGCRRLNNQYPNGAEVTIYSFSYLWNFLWVIFWFYFPFILVMPIKFIIDGYSKDKQINKKDKK